MTARQYMFIPENLFDRDIKSLEVNSFYIRRTYTLQNQGFFWSGASDRCWQRIHQDDRQIQPGFGCKICTFNIQIVIRSFLSGILPKFEQSFNSFATTSYDEVDNTETERIWMLRLLKMLQKVKNADFFWNSYDKFLLPYRNCVASSAKNKVFYFLFLKSGPQNVTVTASFCKLGWSADFTRCWKNRGFFSSS